jgi:tetratricopeptide (TPR) repeat protein
MADPCPSPRNPAYRLGIFAVFALAHGLVAGCNPSEKLPEPDVYQSDPEARIAPEKAPLTDEQLGQLYAKWADLLDSEPDYPKSEKFALAKDELQRVANEAQDPHLRANAALLLGALHEARGERVIAIDFYRHATKLVTDDAGPFMALAVALAVEKKYPEALEAQKQATKLDPDNLENWLALGELFVKSGDQESATKAYVDYEVRRKGLIDGLTLKEGDKYRVATKERVAIAEALASAADGGTGIALLYALDTEPEPAVRETIARVMGIQRLSMYEDRLRKHLDKEKDAKVQEAAKWALAEIEREPVEAKPPVLSKAGDADVPDLVKPPGDAPKPDAPAEPDG